MRIVEVYKEIQEQEMNIVSNSVSLYRTKLIAFFPKTDVIFIGIENTAKMLSS